MDDFIVATTEMLSDGDHLVVELKGREVAVFNVAESYYAYPNWCPHQGGPLCEGQITGNTDVSFDRDTLEYDVRWTKEGEVLVCPWHAWEFDLTENAFLHDGDVSLPSYPVRVEDGDVVVSI